MMESENQNSIMGGQSNNSEDCLGCRLVSGGGLMGASLYVGYHGSRNSHPVGRMLTFLFAGALGGVGFTRLFKLPPFDKSSQNKEMT